MQTLKVESLPRLTPWFCSVAILCSLAPTLAIAEQSLSVGYGFAYLNLYHNPGYIQGSKQYDFFQVAYDYEKQVWLKNLAVLGEPWAAYINRPADGADVGFNLGIKYYVPINERWKPYFVAAAGIAYTTTGFKEQGTHLLFTPQAGFGLRYRNFFIEDRLRHYSNAHTDYPNRSVHANIISVGYYF